MKVLRKTIVTLLLVSVLLGTLVFVYLYSTSPDYSGEFQSSFVKSKVTVLRDTYGVPHIYAENETDAHFALGYVHAQDRLFQMEMIKRAASGRLSEVLGADLLKTDQYFRALGIVETAKKSAQEFLAGDEPYAQAALAYMEGINTFIREGKTPLEFQLAGIPKEEFKPSDMYLVAGFMSVGFAEGFRTDPVLTFINAKWGKEYLNVLSLVSNAGTEFLPSYDTSVFELSGPMSNETSEIQKDSEVLSFSAIMEKLPVPLFHGSNSWVVSGKKSTSGKPILANDTHIGFSQPSVWYEAHVNYPGQSLYGHYAAGFPFAILGHNKQVAWGITMLENDDLDFYIEKIDPNDSLQYWHDSTWKKMNVRMETIKIKDQEDHLFPVMETVHGPVVNEVIPHFPPAEKQPVSVMWEFSRSTSEILQACYIMNQSTTVMDIKKSSSMINAPGLNLMTADQDGNIGWFTTGKFWKRKPHVNSLLFLNGDGSDDPDGSYPHEINPHSINPPWNYVYSANNQPDSVNGLFHPGYYYPEDRAERIKALLEARNTFSLDDMKEINLDVYSIKDLEVRDLFVEILESLEMNDRQKEILNHLKDWDGQQKREEIGPTLYYGLLSQVLFNSMVDELGVARWRDFNSLAVMKRSNLAFISAAESPWWDNKTTEQKEDRAAIFKHSWAEVDRIYTEKLGSDITTWSWGKVHTLTHPHPLGQIELLAPIFNVGPFAVDGGSETINNLNLKLDNTGDFPVIGGPALRKIIDLANMNGAESVLPSGQSGVLMSEHYADQAYMFSEGLFRNLWFEKTDVEEHTKNTLIINPNE